MRDFIQQKLQQRKQENAFRQLTVTNGLIDFTSNDYLGLARAEELFDRIEQKLKSLPKKNGASGSRLLSGNDDYTQTVEKKLAKIFKGEAALIFNSGYAANQAVLSSIPQKGDTILYDEFAHACIRDGARLSLANRYSFAHNDLNDLEQKLRRATGNIFIAIESIYSMDGDQCPLTEITALSKQYNATIILDEAHSTGVMGKNGSGLAVNTNQHNEIDIRIYTFGKAMGVHGACVVGSADLIAYLINFARPFIFTTALSPHSIVSIDEAFQYLGEHLDLQHELSSKINVFKSNCKARQLQIIQSSSQIQGIIIRSNDAVKRAATHLQTQEFDVRPILSPTVAKGSERLRICLHTYNSSKEIEALTHELSILTSSI